MGNHGRIPTWTFADRLRKARREADLSQKDLAKLLGVPLSTLSHWELGIAKPRDFILACKEVEQVTGVDAGWLSGLETGVDRWTGTRNGQVRVGRPHQDRRVFYGDDS